MRNKEKVKRGKVKEKRVEEKKREGACVCLVFNTGALRDVAGPSASSRRLTAGGWMRQEAVK